GGLGVVVLGASIAFACPEHLAGKLIETPIVKTSAPAVSRPVETPAGCRASSSPRPCVAFDARADQLWLRANGAKLGDVLAAVGQALGLAIDARDETYLADTTAIDVGPVTSTQALKMLLAGFNSTFMYGAPAP